MKSRVEIAASRSGPESGSVLLVALFVTFIVSVLVAGFLKLALFELIMSERALLSNSSLNIAESGADDAVWALNRNDWTDWMLDGAYARKEMKDIAFGDGSSGEYAVIVEEYTSAEPVIFVEGRTQTPNGLEFSRQIEIALTTRSNWANGMTARGEIVFSGNSISIDSYDSRDGPYDPLLNRGYRGTVASNSVSATIDVGNASIFGFLATGGAAPDLGPNAEVRGEDPPPEGNVDMSRITYDFFANLPEVDPPTLSSPISSLPPKIGQTYTIGDPSGLTVEEYNLQNLTLSGQEHLEIVGPVVLVVDQDISITGQAAIDIVGNGSSKVFVEGSFNLSGGGIVNGSLDPTKVLIYGANDEVDGQDINISGNAALYAAIYAPNAKLKYSGTVDHYGSIVSNKIDISGDVTFHYDEYLDGIFDQNPSFKLGSWRELVSQHEKINFSTYPVEY